VAVAHGLVHDRAVRPALTLASQSPRRRALLEAACFDVTVVVSGADETWPGGQPSAATVLLARRKLDAVPGVVPCLAADTIVWTHAGPLGKPADHADAKRMLRSLSGMPHRVTTGFAVRGAKGDLARAVTTEVCFRALSETEIERYVATGEPLDKAGGYAIQGLGGALVDWVRGSYTNIIGLPLPAVLAALAELG
jgi:septum formation protein